ncbi:MAG: transcriptional repressor [Flavobacteriales bacterium]|nr:transcriptional repressor [Flavobacteriales bacterium]
MNTTNLSDLLKKRGLKATVNRVNLLEKMQKHGSAMGYSSIQNEMKPIDRVTLYRILESLKEKGVIHKAFQENNETYYAICGTTCNTKTHSHEHIHFKCSNCNSVTCVEQVKSINIKIPNYEIHDFSINATGLCFNCN